MGDAPSGSSHIFARALCIKREATIQNDISLTVATSAVSSHCFEWVARSGRRRLAGSEAELLQVGRRLCWKVTAVLMADGNEI
jgi:hypothetical protein